MRHCFSLLILILLLSGCNFPVPGKGMPPSPTPKTTKPVHATATLPATITPLPSNTPLPALPTATRVLSATPNVARTESAAATLTAAAEMSGVSDALQKLGFSPSDGTLAWKSVGSTDITTTAYMEQAYRTVSKGAVTNFVFQTDVAWNSSSGLAGCGVVFRGTSDYDTTRGSFYWFAIQRLAYSPGYDMEYWEQGDWKATLTNNAVQRDKTINDKQDSVNTISLVVQGKNFTPYINGKMMVSGSNDKLKDGLVALLTFQESGKTTCTFTNGWLFILK